MIEWHQPTIKISSNSLRIVIYYSTRMADEEFQVIITNGDYEKLQAHQHRNEELNKINENLLKENSHLTVKNKDLTRSIYVRDSYIDHLVNEFQATFAEILGLEIISNDITASFYQDVVSHEHNGISSIELRHAMEAFQDKNNKVFERANDLIAKFGQQERRNKELEKELKEARINLEESKQKVSIIAQSSNTNQLFEKEQLLKELKALELSIGELNKERKQLDKANLDLIDKNIKISKEIEILSKKRDTASEKSYVIKLMVDEYYMEIEKSLQKMGGLTDEEIGTVVSNEMKGIVQYINSLCWKNGKRK